MSLNLTLNNLLLIVTMFVVLHGPINSEPAQPVRVALPLMICPR